jgi:DNA-binding transcriptional ArsR family regulator
VHGADVAVSNLPLSTLLGVTRTRLISALIRRSATTTELAAELRMAPSTVSYHLAMLTNAGVAGSMRAGPLVYYHLTDRGFRLLQV